MNLVTETVKDGLKIFLQGENISMNDAIDFKKQLSLLVSKNAPSKLQIFVEEAYFLPSSIIGSLLKYKEIEKIEVELFIKKPELIDSLEKLNLTELLNARAY
ncbi:MAG: hypothetical protein JHC37_05080 [Campylobacteraceae bacterium]|nr:hypothetical protein [Campylobacteraceae bacterium]